MTTALVIAGIVLLVAWVELWPSPLDRRIRARRRARQNPKPRKPRLAGAYRVGSRHSAPLEREDS